MRYEYKHLIPNSKLHQLRQIIAPYVSIDPYAARTDDGQYTVRSIYFDTVNWDMYFEKDDGLAYRDKVRLRAYNDWVPDTKAFLEIKRKYQVPSRKFRVSVDYQKVLQSFKERKFDHVYGELSDKEQINAKRFFYQILSKQLLPVILVSYEREAFISKENPENNVRITFDKNVRSSAFPGVNGLFEERLMRPTFSGYTVLEIKFNEYFPTWLQPIIAAFNLKREALSKYANSLDILQLPHQYKKSSQVRMNARFWQRRRENSKLHKIKADKAIPPNFLKS